MKKKQNSQNRPVECKWINIVYGSQPTSKVGSHLYISEKKKLLVTAGNLKVHEQSKYKSVPILFLFVVFEGNPEICNFWFFEPVI